MNKLFTGVFLLLLLLPVHLCAQVDDTTAVSVPKSTNKYLIKGVVTDAVDNNPVAFAAIFFSGTSIGVTTDIDGNYAIEIKELPSDSLLVQVVGYKTKTIYIERGNKNLTYNITLERSEAYLEEVVVRPGEDPAIVLMKTVIRQKPRNNTDRLDNYQCEAYNKIEVDLLNFNRKTFERLPVPFLKKLGFIFDNMDSTSYNKPFLPFYLTEALSNYYYQRNPKRSKEYVKATQIKLLTNKNMSSSMSQYLGKIYLAINPYDNYVPFFDKEFVSPLSNTALGFYKYKIVDTQQLNGYDIITVKFTPQRKGENCFEGTLRVVDSVFAVQYIAADMPTSANVNWVKASSFYKEYTPLGDSLWFCTKENITAELELTEQMIKTVGFIVRKTTTYDDVLVNSPATKKLVNSKEYIRDVIVDDSATTKDDAYWKANRHEELSENEQGIYDMYDSLDKDKSFNRFKTMAKIFATGGYKFGPIELGPYWNAYSNNILEGSRVQFSMGTTPKLFKDIYMSGYLAYGFGDKQYKYNISSLFLLNRAPRRYFNFDYTHDIDYTVNYYDKVSFNNVFTNFIRKRGIPQKFMFADDIRFELYNESFWGFSQLLTFYRKEYSPYAPLPSVTVFEGINGMPTSSVVTSEVNLRLRFAYKERFLNGNYLRFSLGSKYPIVDLRLAVGVKNLFNSGYDYQRVNFTVSDNWRIPPFGQLYLNLFTGKYFGTLPYPLLEQHPGNEFLFYNKYAFNMMNQYEFISDQYVGANFEHSLGGGFLKYIPLIKKLKFRQCWTAKGLLGSLSAANVAYNFNKGYNFRSLNGTPYLEVGTGIENILKIFRVDFVWRITPESLPNEPVQRNFGIFASAKAAF